MGVSLWSVMLYIITYYFNRWKVNSIFRKYHKCRRPLTWIVYVILYCVTIPLHQNACIQHSSALEKDETWMIVLAGACGRCYWFLTCKRKNSSIRGFTVGLFIEWRRARLVLYLHLESSIFIQIAPVGWIIFLLNVREIRKKKIQRRLGQQGKIELWNLANYHCGWLLRFANGAN